jgi:hypothetical protein
MHFILREENKVRLGFFHVSIMLKRVIFKIAPLQKLSYDYCNIMKNDENHIL